MVLNVMARIVNMMPGKLRIAISKAVVNVVLKMYADIDVSGKENLQGIKKPTIFICNHLSNSDGLVLSKVLKSVNPTFVAGVKLSNNPFTRIGMNAVKTTNIVPNSTDSEGIKNIIKLVRQGNSLLIFPEGTRSRVGSMIKAKNGIVLIARMTGAPIVPIGIYGSEKLLPINSSGKMESEKFNSANVHINIGRQFTLPVRAEEQNKKEYEEYATNYMMYKIAELLPEEYRGVYEIDKK